MLLPQSLTPRIVAILGSKCKYLGTQARLHYNPKAPASQGHKRVAYLEYKTIFIKQNKNTKHPASLSHVPSIPLPRPPTSIPHPCTYRTYPTRDVGQPRGGRDRILTNLVISRSLHPNPSPDLNPSPSPSPSPDSLINSLTPLPTIQ